MAMEMLPGGCFRGTLIFNLSRFTWANAAIIRRDLRIPSHTASSKRVKYKGLNFPLVLHAQISVSSSKNEFESGQ